LKASSNEKFTSLSTNARAKAALCELSVTNGVNGSNKGIFVLAVVCVENISAFCSAISVIVLSKIVSKSPFPFPYFPLLFFCVLWQTFHLPYISSSALHCASGESPEAQCSADEEI
jgi:hypothetical protein